MSYCQKKFTRRKIMKFIILSAAIPILSPLINQAHASKASKESMKYQEKPNDKEQCSNCLQFIQGKSPVTKSECKVVEGSISPKGWCVAYAKK